MTIMTTVKFLTFLSSNFASIAISFLFDTDSTERRHVSKTIVRRIGLFQEKINNVWIGLILSDKIYHVTGLAIGAIIIYIFINY